MQRLLLVSILWHNFTQSLISAASGSYMQNYAFENLVKRFPALGELGEELSQSNR